jgi:NNMT/PNMT/TEMT family
MRNVTSEIVERSTVAAVGPLGNADCPWDEFDSTWYVKHNYSVLRADDRAIIHDLAEFFAAKAPARNWHGIDVGSGTNLYPALAMLPLAESITLWERSAANVRWLEHEVRPYGQAWDQYWDALCTDETVYQRVRRPRSLLPVRTKIEQASIYELPLAVWDVGTMFFVAESITGIRAEFELATKKFLQSLKPGAPFAAAFMRNSAGYSVGDLRFPAVAVTESDVRRVLSKFTTDLRVRRIASSDLRHGYDGMILALGTRGRGNGAKW